MIGIASPAISQLIARLRVRAQRLAVSRARRASASRTRHPWRRADSLWPDIFKDG
jgi:hypothetical protein